MKAPYGNAYMDYLEAQNEKYRELQAEVKAHPLDEVYAVMLDDTQIHGVFATPERAEEVAALFTTTSERKVRVSTWRVEL